MKRYSLLLAVAILGVGAFVWPAGGRSEIVGRRPAVVVEGRVEDSTGAALRGIGVRAVRAGSNIAETASAVDGKYRLELRGVGAFDLVFDEPEYQPAVLTALSGNTGHSISKVMLREGEELDRRSRIAAAFAQDYLLSLGGL